MVTSCYQQLTRQSLVLHDRSLQKSSSTYWNLSTTIIHQWTVFIGPFTAKTQVSANLTWKGKDLTIDRIKKNSLHFQIIEQPLDANTRSKISLPTYYVRPKITWDKRVCLGGNKILRPPTSHLRGMEVEVPQQQKLGFLTATLKLIWRAQVEDVLDVVPTI